MRRLLLAVLLLVATPLAAQAPPGGETVNLEYTEETLPNGLKVIYHVDRSTPVAAAVMWYNVASKHEPPGRTGFAHLFEHLMLFTGSRNVPEGRGWAMLEAAGGRAGPDLNGTTSADRTNYFSQVPSNALELALWIEADRMATLDDALTQTKLDNQREVVKNERRQGMDNQPYGLWVQKMLGHLFPEGHPYHHPVIGSLEDLNNATLRMYATSSAPTTFRTTRCWWWRGISRSRTRAAWCANISGGFPAAPIRHRYATPACHRSSADRYARWWKMPTPPPPLSTSDSGCRTPANLAHPW